MAWGHGWSGLREAWAKNRSLLSQPRASGSSASSLAKSVRGHLLVVAAVCCLSAREFGDALRGRACLDKVAPWTQPHAYVQVKT